MTIAAATVLLVLIAVCIVLLLKIEPDDKPVERAKRPLHTETSQLKAIDPHRSLPPVPPSNRHGKSGK